jgi:hypothetical protein
MQVFYNSQGASANAILPNLSMSLRLPNPFLYGDSGTGKMNGIFERCLLFHRLLLSNLGIVTAIRQLLQRGTPPS